MIFASLIIAALAGGSSAETVTRARYLMGTVCEITGPAGRIEAAFDEAARIESFLSTWRGDSELSRLNAESEAEVSPELSSLLQRTLDWSAATNGAFNPLVRPLIDAWRTRGEGAVPADIHRALARTNIANVAINGQSVRLAGGAQFEEGAFGKGYAIDRMLTVLECGGHAAVLQINFGGQVALRGTTRVTIADPERRDTPVVAFTLRDASLSTSSGSEKTFEVGGVRFTHIIDPRTGQALPPRGSVSVVAPDAFDADVLSTALYVMNAEEGLRWADARGVAALFITPQHEILASAAMPPIEILDHKFKLKD